MIYLDSAATCALDERSKNKMLEVWNQWACGKFANIGGVYKSAERSARYLNELRGALKDITVGEYVVFTSSSSEANSMVFNHANKIITTCWEHPSLTKHPKATFVQFDKLKDELKNGPAVVSLVGIHHEIGSVRDIRVIYDLCKQYHSKLHIDASQMKSFDMQYADFMTISSHKIGGPIGVAALVTKEPMKAIIFGGMQEDGMRAGTNALPLIAGFVEALQVLKENAGYAEQFKLLNALLRKNIDERYFLETYAKDIVFCNHIVCLVTKFPASEIAAFMDMHDIAVAVGSACTSGALDGMKILNSIHQLPDELKNGVRLSFGPNTTEEEIIIFSQKFNQFVSRK